MAMGGWAASPVGDHELMAGVFSYQMLRSHRSPHKFTAQVHVHLTSWSEEEEPDDPKTL